MSHNYIAIYKGRKYRLLWGPGQTKYGKRAKLGFFDGAKEFWVDADKISVNPKASWSRCVCCGRPVRRGQTYCRDCPSEGITNPYEVDPRYCRS